VVVGLNLRCIFLNNRGGKEKERDVLRHRLHFNKLALKIMLIKEKLG